MKPFSFERFAVSAEKVLREFEAERNFSGRKFAFFKSGNKSEKVDFEDILYIEGMKDYLAIVTSKKRIMTLLGFSEMKAILPAKEFARVHKSFVVRIDKIDSIERNCINIRGKAIPIGAGYKAEFENAINA